MLPTPIGSVEISGSRIPPPPPPPQPSVSGPSKTSVLQSSSRYNGRSSSPILKNQTSSNGSKQSVDVASIQHAAANLRPTTNYSSIHPGSLTRDRQLGRPSLGSFDSGWTVSSVDERMANHSRGTSFPSTPSGAEYELSLVNETRPSYSMKTSGLNPLSEDHLLALVDPNLNSSNSINNPTNNTISTTSVEKTSYQYPQAFVNSKSNNLPVVTSTMSSWYTQTTTTRTTTSSNQTPTYSSSSTNNVHFDTDALLGDLQNNHQLPREQPWYDVVPRSSQIVRFNLNERPQPQYQNIGKPITVDVIPTTQFQEYKRPQYVFASPQRSPSRMQPYYSPGTQSKQDLMNLINSQGKLASPTPPPPPPHRSALTSDPLSSSPYKNSGLSNGTSALSPALRSPSVEFRNSLEPRLHGPCSPLGQLGSPLGQTGSSPGLLQQAINRAEFVNPDPVLRPSSRAGPDYGSLGYGGAPGYGGGLNGSPAGGYGRSSTPNYGTYNSPDRAILSARSASPYSSAAPYSTQPGLLENAINRAAAVSRNNTPARGTSATGYQRRQPNHAGVMLTGDANLDSLTLKMLKSMETGDGAAGTYMCAQCNEGISSERPGCTALSQTYHIACFKCYSCQIQLAGCSFYAVDGKAYCEKDYVHTLDRCAICDEPILDRILRASGKAYHPECFNCSECRKGLDSVPFTVDNNNAIHCVPCFHQKYAPRCAICTGPIVPKEGEDGSLRVLALDRSFHIHCYKCQDCGLKLSSKIEGHECYPLDDQLFCRNCNAERVRKMTA